jgi:hypothetical protein
MTKAILRAIVPKKLWDTPGMQRELMKAVDDTTDVVLRDFQATTATWDHKVKFERTRASLTGGDIVGVVGTDDEIYGYVTRGTRPHDIQPSGAQVLAFPASSSPKTMPRVLGSRSGSRSKQLIFTDVVHHPGTEPREFEETIIDTRQKLHENNVAEAVNRALRG